MKCFQGNRFYIKIDPGNRFLFLSKNIFLVKMVKTVENFEMSFLPVLDQKYRFSLPFLAVKITFFSKNVKNRNFEKIWNFLKNRKNRQKFLLRWEKSRNQCMPLKIDLRLLGRDIDKKVFFRPLFDSTGFLTWPFSEVLTSLNATNHNKSNAIILRSIWPFLRPVERF